MSYETQSFVRRTFLSRTACGIGAAALSSLLTGNKLIAGQQRRQRCRPDAAGGAAEERAADKRLSLVGHGKR